MVTILSSCDGFRTTPPTSPTNAMDTAISMVYTQVSKTQAAIPTATPTTMPYPLATPLPPTETSIPTSALSFSGTPTIIPVGNGLTLSECVVPYDDYAGTESDMKFLESCNEIPIRNEDDKKRMGERIENQNGFSDWRITIGNDYFETKSDDLSRGCCSYQLLKNGKVILEISPGFWSSDPNRGFWNIGGKLVWELGGFTSVIVVDGVNYNEKNDLEGSYFPYEIKGKLIYIARKNGRFYIVYDEKIIGAEFDSISMAYCCGMISVYYGSGQYWFVGRRGGTKFVVSIR